MKLECQTNYCGQTIKFYVTGTTLAPLVASKYGSDYIKVARKDLLPEYQNTGVLDYDSDIRIGDIFFHNGQPITDVVDSYVTARKQALASAKATINSGIESFSAILSWELEARSTNKKSLNDPKAKVVFKCKLKYVDYVGISRSQHNVVVDLSDDPFVNESTFAHYLNGSVVLAKITESLCAA